MNAVANANFFNDYAAVLETRVLMNVKADSYTAIFHVTQVGETAADADKFMNERIDGLKASIKDLRHSQVSDDSRMKQSKKQFRVELERARVELKALKAEIDATVPPAPGHQKTDLNDEE